MQYAKDEIRKRMIDIAREEFLEKGFDKASVRTITAKAKTSKSNLYNYYADKDALFCAVLEPTVAEIRAGLEAAKQSNVPKDAADYTFSSQQAVIRVIAEFIACHTGDVKLLLFKAQGSSLEHFKDEVLDAFTDNMTAWTQSIRTKKAVSRLFVRTVCSFYLNLIEQLLLVNTTADFPQFFGEISAFVYHGWKSVLGEEKE